MDMGISSGMSIQELVNTLRCEVAQKEAELKALVAHRAKLFKKFSAPTFPRGYSPSGAGCDEPGEPCTRPQDNSNDTPSLKTNASGRFRKRKENPILSVEQDKVIRRCLSRQKGPFSRSASPSIEHVSQVENGGYESEVSGDSHDTQPQAKSKYTMKANNRVADAPESSCSEGTWAYDERKTGTDREVLTGKDEVIIPAVNWGEQTGKRGVLNDDPPSDTDSNSSDDSKAKDVFQPVEVQISDKNAASAAVQPAKVVSQAVTLAIDAPAEDLFDWEVLGLSGPWLQEKNAGFLAESSWSQLQKRQTSLPCQFKTTEEYKSSFEGLIIAECRAQLDAAWETQKSQEVGTDVITSGDAVMADGKGKAMTWQFRSMYPCQNDPFKYIETEILQGPAVRLDPNEMVLLSNNDRNMLGIVALTNQKGVLLKTRVEFRSSQGQCTLLRLANLVTLKRQFISLSKISEIWDPLQRQLLDPLTDIKLGNSLSMENEKLSAFSMLTTWQSQHRYNLTQIEAMKSLLLLKQGFLLVQGPPGTGKTSTIVGMISAVRVEEPRARILVCASSNAAVDEIVSRLMYGMVDKNGKSYTPTHGSLVRLGVQNSIQPSCLPVSLDNFLQGNTIASKPNKRDILAGASIICCTISGSGHQVFDELNQKFDLLILDEAAQALESEVLIALQRVKGRCVMVGDPCQLPAVVLQRPGTAYGRSLFERMQEAGRPVSLMTIQYRMHPHISKFPSSQFYNHQLKNADATKTMASNYTDEAIEMGINISGYKFKLGAYSFLDVTWGTEKGETVGHSLSNVDEAEVVATVVQGIVKSLRKGIEPNIGVITPYVAQRSVITNSLAELEISESFFEVNTVDGFQGREKDVIVLSCVRAQTDHGLGFVSDVRRMNVALTRARHSLIIVGHAVTLRRQSVAWSALLKDATSRGFYQILQHKPKTKPAKPGLLNADSHEVKATTRPEWGKKQIRFEERPGNGPGPRHVRFDGDTGQVAVSVSSAGISSGDIRIPRHRRFNDDSAQTTASLTTAGTDSRNSQGPRHIRFDADTEQNAACVTSAGFPVASNQPSLELPSLDLGTSERGGSFRNGIMEAQEYAIDCMQEQGSNRYEDGNRQVVQEGLKQQQNTTRIDVKPMDPRFQAPNLSSTPAIRRMRGQIGSGNAFAWQESNFGLETAANAGTRHEYIHQDRHETGALNGWRVDCGPNVDRDSIPLDFVLRDLQSQRNLAGSPSPGRGFGSNARASHYGRINIGGNNRGANTHRGMSHEGNNLGVNNYGGVPQKRITHGATNRGGINHGATNFGGTNRGSPNHWDCRNMSKGSEQGSVGRHTKKSFQVSHNNNQKGKG